MISCLLLDLSQFNLNDLFLIDKITSYVFSWFLLCKNTLDNSLQIWHCDSIHMTPYIESYPTTHNQFKKYILLVKPLFSLCLGIRRIYPCDTRTFNCLLTVLSDNLESCAIVLTEGKQHHVVRLAYCNNTLYTFTAFAGRSDEQILL